MERNTLHSNAAVTTQLCTVLRKSSAVRPLSLTLVLFLLTFICHAQILKSVVYDFDGFTTSATDLPEGDYRSGDLTYHVATNPLGSNDMLGDRVLKLDLNWNTGTGTFGRGVSKFIEFDPAADKLNFYFYNPAPNGESAIFQVAFGDDDDNSNSFLAPNDDVWVKEVTVLPGNEWQLISIPLNLFVDANGGGNGVLDMRFTGAEGMLLMLEFNFVKPGTAAASTYYIDMIAFSEGDLPTGATIFELPEGTPWVKCPLGAYVEKTPGLEYQVPGEIEALFPSMPHRKLYYVNWFLQFAMDGTTIASQLPGNEVQILLNNGYTPVITWEALYRDFDRLSPVQPRLANIINGEFDSYIDAFADKCKSFNGPVIIRFLHEFEGDWYPWSITHNGNDPNTYITAYRKVVDRFRARGANNVKWMWCVNSDYSPYESFNWFVNAYPGDDYVDYVATDIYNNHWPVTESWWMSFRYKAAESYYYLTKYFPQKPLIICEIGCMERQPGENPASETKRQWWGRVDKELQSNFRNATGLIFFSGIVEHDWRINSSSESILGITESIWMDDHYFMYAPAGFLSGVNSRKQLKIYPNPSKGNFCLSVTDPAKVTAVRIYSEIGQLVYADNKPSFQSQEAIELNLKNIERGIYFIEVISEESTMRGQVVIAE